MKGKIAQALILSMAFSVMSSMSIIAQPDIKIILDGNEINFPDAQAYLNTQTERVMVPIRFVSQALGATVNWYEKTSTVTINKEGSDIAFSIGNSSVAVNNEEKHSDTAAVLQNDRTFVPLRFVSEILGCKVDWQENSSTVTIENADVPPKDEKTNDKKVYALYHGFRRTRENDGELGTWQYSSDSSKSKTDLKYINYNADLIDENGVNQMTSINGGPVVGMQSEIDPEYIEYKMLLAKIANIDGFMVDFGFPEHGNTTLINAFQQVGEKYDMEVGVNWCDNWLYYDWITYYRDDIKTREDKTNYFKTSVQFLLDNVYNKENAAVYKNSPVLFLFGGGPTVDEFKDILKTKFKTSNGLDAPTFIRRTPVGGVLEGNTVNYSDAYETVRQYLDLGIDVHSWIGPRVRPIDEKFPYWDTYGTKEDLLGYAENFSKLWENNQKVKVNTGVATPGFDNRGCAAWGGGKYYGIDRENGDVYRDIWDFHINKKDLLDIMFIASWSDFTEGHEIEPTVKNGYRELETTLEKAAEFKDEDFSEDEIKALRIPEQLFNQRKTLSDLKLTGKDTKEISKMQDAAAMGISNQSFYFATYLLDLTDTLLNDMQNSVITEKISFDLNSDMITVTSTQPNPEVIDPNMIIKGKEVAKGKPVKANSELGADRANRAVDGVIDDSHRWVSNSNEDSYWLEIDLQGSYTLAGADIFTGKDEGSWAVGNLKLQYLDGRIWHDIPGAVIKNNSKTNTDLKITFKETVTTSKLKLVCDEGNRGVRLREIKIYEQGTTNDLPKPPVVPDIDKSYAIENGLYITFNEDLSKKLRDNNFEAYIKFDYFGEDSEKFRITSDSNRPAPSKIGNTVGDFSIVADIKKSPTLAWENCKVELFKQNTAWTHGLTENADIMFKGDGLVKDISFEFIIKK